MSSIPKCLEAVLEELASAQLRYGEFNSAHEGYAVILEEMDELWDEIKKSPSKRNPQALREEAIQACAMTLRFLVDVCE